MGNYLISDSVGNAGRNLPEDVKAVKSLVLAISTSSNVGPTDMERQKINRASGACEPELLSALARFQKRVVPTEAASGGRVVPPGKTLQKLIQYAAGGQAAQESAILANSKAVAGYQNTMPINWEPELLFIRDVSVGGWSPKTQKDNLLEVGRDTPINWPINWVVQKYDECGPVWVKILAHGYGVKVGEKDVKNEKTGQMEKKDVYSQGGGGIWFCQESIELDTTLKLFAPWKGKVVGIDLLSCGIAYITQGFEGKKGDGNLFCYRLAQIAGCKVRASSAIQQYWGDYNHELKLLPKWQGTVYTYSPEGKVINVDYGPDRNTGTMDPKAVERLRTTA